MLPLLSWTAYFPQHFFVKSYTFYALNMLCLICTVFSILLYLCQSSHFTLLLSTLICLLHSDLLTILCLESFFSTWLHCALIGSGCSYYLISDQSTIIVLYMICSYMLDWLFLTLVCTACFDWICICFLGDFWFVLK